MGCPPPTPPLQAPDASMNASSNDFRMYGFKVWIGRAAGAQMPGAAPAQGCAWSGSPPHTHTHTCPFTTPTDPAVPALPRRLQLEVNGPGKHAGHGSVQARSCRGLGPYCTAAAAGSECWHHRGGIRPHLPPSLPSNPLHGCSACPFAHPGEKAMRRDPRTHAYSSCMCPDIGLKGRCPCGSACHYAHHVYEYW